MVYSFARISAAVGMNLEDLVQTGRRSWLRLSEKGGKVHEMPAHHRLAGMPERIFNEIGEKLRQKLRVAVDDDVWGDFRTQYLSSVLGGCLIS